MAYTAQLKELVKIVEKTRPSRVGVDHPRMTPEERQEVLERFHPDFIDEGFRRIRVGVDKGRFAADGDIFVSRSLLVGVEIDLSKSDYEVDVLVIGGGGAGAAAALEAHGGGASVMIATKLRFGDANTMMAQGGIQAAVKANDRPDIHYLDIMGGGRFENIPELVRAAVLDAPQVIAWLEKLGAMFDKDEQGNMLAIHAGTSVSECMPPGTIPGQRL